MFDPSLPSEGSPLQSAVMRSQLTSLKALIDALAPISSAVVDNVSTLPSGDPAAANVTLLGTALHFGFGIPRGVEGAQGPPFASAVVDGVNTLPPWSPATVSVTFDGTQVHFTFSIPQGYDGATGPQGIPGPPGEVTTSELNNAISGTAQNPVTVSPLSQTADGTYNQGQLQQVMNKLDELLGALKRT